MSEAFDNFSLGKLLTLSRKVKEKETQSQELKKENSDLRNQLINVTTSVTQKQVNSTFVMTDELAKMFTVKQADEPEKEQQKQEAEEVRPLRTDEGAQRKYIPFSQFEEIALPKFLQAENLQQFPLLRDAKLVNHFQQIDPIREYSPVFDGYIKTVDTEIFIEFRPKTRSTIMLRERLYLMLSKVSYYRTVKRVNAYLFLVLVTRHR